MAQQTNNLKDTGSSSGGRNQRPSGRNKQTIILLVIAVILTVIFWTQFSGIRSRNDQEVTYDEFLSSLDEKKIDTVEIHGSKIYYTLKSDQSSENSGIAPRYYVMKTDDYELVSRLHAAGVKFRQVSDSGTAVLREIVSWVLTIAAFYVLMMLITRRMTGGNGVMGVGKSGAKVYGIEKNTGVRFADVAGEDEAKESLSEMVDFLKDPKKYLAIGAKLPRGALLVGPPGTGKTMLAKAVAGEAGVPFLSISGSEFVELYVGVGASRVRDLFRQAEAKAPCIIFIDEIDAIGRSRDTRHMGGDSEREQTLNQLLAEMDGFDTSRGIIVLAATNRPEVLDKALLRPGRFDRRIVVEKPDQPGREQILKVHSKNVRMDDTVDLHELAFATSGSSGADLANIINEAALTAVRKGRKAVSQADLIESVEVVFAGKEKKDRLLSPKEKQVVAYHESGHALLTMLQKHTMPVQKITIVPRTMGSLGYVWQTPEEEHYLETQDEIEAHIVIAMGGRAAEALKFPSVTSGAANDIEQATKEARQMVTRFGMSEKFGMMQLEDVTGQYLDERRVLECSEETAAKVDREVRNILRRAYSKAYRLLKKNEKTLDAVAAYLVEHESITGEEFVRIYQKITGEEKGKTQPQAVQPVDQKPDSQETSFEDAMRQYADPVAKSSYKVYASEEFLKYRDQQLKDEEPETEQSSETKKKETSADEKKENPQPENDGEEESVRKPWEEYEEQVKSARRTDETADLTEDDSDGEPENPQDRNS